VERAKEALRAFRKRTITKAPMDEGLAEEGETEEGEVDEQLMSAIAHILNALMEIFVYAESTSQSGFTAVPALKAGFLA
jgi:hypothetical protein